MLDRPAEKCLEKHLIVTPGMIHYLRFLIEAYEGIAVVSTIDPSLGLVKLCIAPGCEEDIDRILAAECSSLQPREIHLMEPLELSPINRAQ